MIRKMLVIAAAIAMPVSVIAVSGVTAGAASKPPPDPAITCAVTATVTFAAPGISNAGSVSTSKTSNTTTSGESFSTKGSDGACTGSAPDNTITSKSVKCTGVHTPSSNTACPMVGVDPTSALESSPWASHTLPWTPSSATSSLATCNSPDCAVEANNRSTSASGKEDSDPTREAGWFGPPRSAECDPRPVTPTAVP